MTFTQGLVIELLVDFGVLCALAAVFAWVVLGEDREGASAEDLNAAGGRETSEPPSA